MRGSRSPARPAVLVTTAAQAAAADRAAIAAGVPSRALMQRAGAAAAGEIARRYPDGLGGGVHVFAGPGNNGGDAWAVAAALARWGAPVAVTAVGGDEPRTEDARFERARALARLTRREPTGRERVIVDGVYGTGFTARAGSDGGVGELAARLRRLREDGATVVSLDVPSGLDATSGGAGGGCVEADLTLTFGTLKRGLLVNRAAAGVVVVLDIGLGADEAVAGAIEVAAPDALEVEPLAADAHKGTRGKLAVVGGAAGMAGAARLAADAALRSGAGMVRALVAPESVVALQIGLPATMTAPWPGDAGGLRAPLLEWADAVLLGPGLGRSPEAGALCERVLAAWRGPVVLDADALNHFAGRLDALAPLLAGRPALLTPHPVELARLLGATVDDVLARRFEIGAEVAERTGAAVLLKGVPTVVSAGGRTVAVPGGTPALATAGSGDVLGGIAGALLAASAAGARRGTDEAPDPADAARRAGVTAALAHGRAGELATERRGGVRGTTLDDVLAALGDAWPRPGRTAPRPPYPVLLELPAVPG